MIGAVLWVLLIGLLIGILFGVWKLLVTTLKENAPRKNPEKMERPHPWPNPPDK